MDYAESGGCTTDSRIVWTVEEHGIKRAPMKIPVLLGSKWFTLYAVASYYHHIDGEL